MSRVTICMAVAGFLLAPALAWADGACCGQTASNDTVVTTSSDTSGACNTCNTCKPKCGFCAWLSGKCGHKCDTCGSCTTKQKVQCCHEKTSYRMVRTCEPVCHEKTVKYRDPCNPCVKTCRIETECHNRTRYHWVAETKPSCHTKTVRVCSTCNPCEAGVAATPTALGGTEGTVPALSETVHNEQNE